MEAIYIWYIFMDVRDGSDIYMVYIHGCKGRGDIYIWYISMDVRDGGDIWEGRGGCTEGSGVSGICF